MKHRSIVHLNQDSATVRMPRTTVNQVQVRAAPQATRYCVVEERFARRLESPHLYASGLPPATSSWAVSAVAVVIMERARSRHVQAGRRFIRELGVLPSSTTPFVASGMPPQPGRPRIAMRRRMRARDATSPTMTVNRSLLSCSGVAAQERPAEA